MLKYSSVVNCLITNNSQPNFFIYYNTERWEDTNKGGNSWTIGNMIIRETRSSYYQTR